jgi:hypothetical protein
MSFFGAIALLYLVSTALDGLCVRLEDLGSYLMSSRCIFSSMEMMYSHCRSITGIKVPLDRGELGPMYTRNRVSIRPDGMRFYSY